MKVGLTNLYYSEDLSSTEILKKEYKQTITNLNYKRDMDLFTHVICKVTAKASTTLQIHEDLAHRILRKIMRKKHPSQKVLSVTASLSISHVSTMDQL